MSPAPRQQLALEAEYADGWHRAVALAAALRAGHPPPTQSTTLVMQPGEVHYCGVWASAAVFVAGDGSYSQAFVVAGRTWKGFVATGAMSALWNRRQRTKAEREAAVQWRPLGAVLAHATSMRLVLLIDGAYYSYWYSSGIAAFDPAFEHYAALIHPASSPPIVLEGPAVPYISVLVHTALRREVPMIGSA